MGANFNLSYRLGKRLRVVKQHSQGHYHQKVVKLQQEISLSNPEPVLSEGGGQFFKVFLIPSPHKCIMVRDSNMLMIWALQPDFTSVL